MGYLYLYSQKNSRQRNVAKKKQTVSHLVLVRVFYVGTPRLSDAPLNAEWVIIACEERERTWLMEVSWDGRWIAVIRELTLDRVHSSII